MAKPLPNHDFHNSWGCIYSGETTAKDEAVRQWWQDYFQNPALVETRYHDLLSTYTQLFAAFFGGYYPISLHAHVSDALSPTTVASLILNTCATSPLIFKNTDLAPSVLPTEDGKKVQEYVLEYLGWNESHVTNPRIAAVRGIYGAAFGPLAHASKEWEVQIIASGLQPTVIQIGDSHDALSDSLAEAKRQCCIAVVIDMVSTENGAVLAPDRFKMLKKCCAKEKLWLIVDEALTAIRCGAPFCFQRDEYGKEGPDLVSFGKGLGVSGIVINFASPMTRCLGFVDSDDRHQTIMYWRALVSRPVTMPVLLDALGILYAARDEDWPKRSLAIGETICDIIQGYHPGEEVYGLGAIIVVDKETTMRMNIMAGTRRRCQYSRWLPKLDTPYADRQVLEAYVFGPLSKQHRATLSLLADTNSTHPAWCFICGIESTSNDWCRTCFLGRCQNEVCEETFKQHTCL
ncbi:hypothetical protein BJX68DRAFT_276724 [Aspergillus pseudodeflectus]|uniref:Pyridoxal phosphate-dependent transferase n=1 Tax=Aspergillus pseudodeflectus TaxID=176178 RepID=A0ABR4L4F7_9EURO